MLFIFPFFFLLSCYSVLRLYCHLPIINPSSQMQFAYMGSGINAQCLTVGINYSRFCGTIFPRKMCASLRIQSEKNQLRSCDLRKDIT